MPKLTVFKKNKMKSSCGDLFADAGLKTNFDDDNVKPHFNSDNLVDGSCSVANSADIVGGNVFKDEKPSKRVGGSKRKGSPNVKEKSNFPSQDIEKFGNTIDEDSSGHIVNEKCPEGCRDVRERKGTGKSEKHCKVSRKSIPGPEKSNRCFDEGNLKTSRGTKGKRRKDESTSSEACVGEEGRLKLKDYPIDEFLDSDRILNPRNVDFEMADTDDELSIWIVLDGKRHRVSKWSVVEGVYHQGLDSLFLVKHYKPCKSNK